MNNLYVMRKTSKGPFWREMPKSGKKVHSHHLSPTCAGKFQYFNSVTPASIRLIIH